MIKLLQLLKDTMLIHYLYRILLGPNKLQVLFKWLVYNQFLILNINIFFTLIQPLNHSGFRILILFLMLLEFSLFQMVHVLNFTIILESLWRLIIFIMSHWQQLQDQLWFMFNLKWYPKKSLLKRRSKNTIFLRYYILPWVI